MTTPLIEALRQQYPHGHAEFVSVLVEKMQLHSDKNHDYAKGGNPLGNFERVASILSLYPGLSLSDPVVVMLVYALKQIDATLWGFSQQIEQKVEGPIDRLGDVLVYAGIAICALKDRVMDDRTFYETWAPVVDTRGGPGFDDIVTEGELHAWAHRLSGQGESEPDDVDAWPNSGPFDTRRAGDARL